MDDGNFDALYAMQHTYNDRVRLRDHNDSKEAWTQTYLIGIASEFDEILREINWKKHRPEDVKTDMTNLGYELADLTKYVLSLWEVWGFSTQDIMNFCIDKSRILNALWEQEYMLIPSGAPVIICDIDGTLGDWRSSFISWVSREHAVTLPKDTSKSLLMDVDLETFYPHYHALKEEFEATGGYANIEPYQDLIDLIKEIRNEVYLIIMTDRPQKRYHRIWWDTVGWLHMHGINPTQLLMGAEPRILLAAELIKSQRVILIDDNPGLMLRAAMSGIQVFSRSQPYNLEVCHPNIIHVDSFSAFQVRDSIIKELQI